MTSIFDWSRRKRRKNNNPNKQQARISILSSNEVNMAEKSMMVQLNELAYFSETHLRQKLTSKFFVFQFLSTSSMCDKLGAYNLDSHFYRYKSTSSIRKLFAKWWNRVWEWVRVCITHSLVYDSESILARCVLAQFT